MLNGPTPLPADNPLTTNPTPEWQIDEKKSQTCFCEYRVRESLIM
jgi:hypothetical protein